MITAQFFQVFVLLFARLNTVIYYLLAEHNLGNSVFSTVGKIIRISCSLFATYMSDMP